MQQATEDARFLTTGEAARQLTISRTTLRRAVPRGTIIPVMRAPGGFARFVHADIETCANRPRDGISARRGC